jgi:hypothetical protein
MRSPITWPALLINRPQRVCWRRLIAISDKQRRDIPRSVHLVVSHILLGYLHIPLGDNDVFYVADEPPQ